MTPHEGSVALFHLDPARRPIKMTARQVHDGEPSCLHATLDRRTRDAQPASTFSPNVLLRPLVQDTLFPTICYVAGPNELAYLGQLKQVYAHFGVPMPLIHPRATATIVDSAALRFLTKLQSCRSTASSRATNAR